MMKKAILWLVCLMLAVAPALAQGGAVVAEVGGTKITRAEVDAAFMAAYGEQYEAEEAFELRHGLVEQMLRETTERLMQQQMGFDTPSQQEIDAVTALAQQEYANYVEYYMALFDDGSMTQEELREMTQAYLRSMDMSLEDYTQQAIGALAGEKLRAWALQGVALSEEELHAAYEAMVRDEQALCSVYPDSFLSCAYYGMPYLYVPEGVREIRQIVVSFDEEQRLEYGFLADAAARGEDASADLDALYAQLDGRVLEIRNQLDSGKSFADVETEYSDDWTMLSADGQAAVRYVCEGAQIWDPLFTQAAMALESVGEISAPVRMSDGVHILCYAADVPSGAVPFEQARDYVAEYALYEKQMQTYEDALTGWMEELGAQIYLEELE